MSHHTLLLTAALFGLTLLGLPAASTAQAEVTAEEPPLRPAMAPT